MPNDDEKIRQFFKTLNTDDLVERLKSGNTTEAAITIGIDELVMRGVEEGVTSSIKEFAIKDARQEKSRKRWLWLLVFFPLFLLLRSYSKQHWHM